MTTALQAGVLVLNKNWTALRISTAAEALTDLFVGRVQAVDTDDQAYNFDDWHTLSACAHDFDATPQPFVKTVASGITVPPVVRLLCFDRVRRAILRLSRLDLDYVVPSSRGSKTTWENLVCCSVAVNARKGGRTPTRPASR